MYLKVSFPLVSSLPWAKYAVLLSTFPPVKCCPAPPSSKGSVTGDYPQVYRLGLMLPTGSTASQYSLRAQMVSWKPAHMADSH